MMMRLVEESRH